MTNKRKYTYMALAVVALAAANTYWLSQRKNPDQSTPVASREVPAGTALLPAEKMIAKAREAVDFPPAAQAEIEKCLGKKAESFSKLEELIGAIAGEPEGNELEWRVVQFEDQGGHPYRIRLAREHDASGKAQLTLSLFSVDAEGLPDRIPLPASESRNPDLDAMNRVLHDKRLVSEVDLNRYRYAQNQEVLLERENGILQKLTYTGGNTRLSCDAAQGSPSCHCVR